LDIELFTSTLKKMHLWCRFSVCVWCTKWFVTSIFHVILPYYYHVHMNCTCRLGTHFCVFFLSVAMKVNDTIHTCSYLGMTVW